MIHRFCALFFLLQAAFLRAELNVDSIYSKRYTKDLTDTAFVIGDLIRGPEIRWSYALPAVQSQELRIQVEPYLQFFLQNRFLICELIVHTDTRGSAEENQKLSLYRAIALVNEIIDSNVVFAERIIAAGKGESQPLIEEYLINSYKNNASLFEFYHQINRRIEIKITGLLGKNFYTNRGYASAVLNSKNVRNPAYYEDLIMIADRALLEENYLKALEYYSYAAEMAPADEHYAAQQRDKIKELISKN